MPLEVSGGAVTVDHVMGIAEISAAYWAGALTPSDVVAQALARLADQEPQLNAFADPMAESALAQAARCTAELASGTARGALHGIPIAVKDLIDVAGAPTGFGTRARPSSLPAKDAQLVARLRAAGAIILGKTNLLEFAYGIAHPAIGQTNNPYDTERTSGGSSGGSAAAVAAGIVPLAIGTDTGGSIRIPASYCGIVGLKPTYDAVPLDGVFPLSWTLDHAGPLARTVEDVAIGLSVLAGLPFPNESRPIAGLRIGRITRHFESPEMMPGVQAALETAFKTLAAQGAVIVEVDIAELAQVNRAVMMIVQAEASAIHRDGLGQNPSGYAGLTREQLQAGFAVSAVDYIDALRLRPSLRAVLNRVLNDLDVLASPTAPFVAPHTDPAIAEGEGEMLSTPVANLSGHPALSLNIGFSGGMPVGLHLMGAYGQDMRLLANSAAVARAVL